MAKKAPMSLTDLNKPPEPAAESNTTSPKIKGYNFRMHDDEFVVLKRASLDTRMTIRDMFAEAMSDWLARKGVPLTFKPISMKKD